MFRQLLQFLTSSGPRLKRDGSRIADQYANVSLLNQYGERVRFVDDFVTDRALIVNSMYTQCRGTCPGTAEKLESLRETLSPVFGDKLTIVSFTLEPTVDTPAVLRKYAKMYGANERRSDLCDWQFLSGTKDNIDALRRSIGFYDLDPKVDQDITQHDSLLLFGNDVTDRWSSLPAQLRLPLLVEAIRRIGGFTFEQRYGIRG